MKQRLALVFSLAALAARVVAQNVSTIIPVLPNSPVEPYAVAADASDNLYVTDPATHRILKFKTVTGELSVFAGKFGEAGYVDGSLAVARFADPRAIIAARGGLVVADAANHVIRFIDLASGTVSTLAGSGVSGQADGAALSAQFRIPRGLAADAAGNIYISDFRARNIRKLDLAGNVTTHAAGFAGPSGISLGEDGTLFVADRGANTIQKVDPSGIVSLLAGSGLAGADDSADPTDVSFDLPDSVLSLGTNFGLMISDSGNHLLRHAFLDPVTGLYTVETYTGHAGQPGSADGGLTNATFNSPAGMTKFSTGLLIADELNHRIRQLLLTPVPPKISDPAVGHIEKVLDPTSGNEVLKLFPVTDAIFNNDLTIGVRGEANVRHLYTEGPGRLSVFDPDLIPVPTGDSPNAPEFFDGFPVDKLPPTLTGPLPILTVKVISSAPGRTPSAMVQGTFRFQVATPSIDSTVNPGNITFKNSTTNALMFYTLDGSDPTNVEGANAASRGPIVDGERIPFRVGVSNLVVKVRGYRQNYSDSQIALATFSPTNFVPNRISLGFESGEASSEFVASPGQRFYAPITLTTIAGQKMYGLSLNVRVENVTGPAPTFNSDYAMAFSSTLKEKILGSYATISNEVFLGSVVTTNFFTQITATSTNIIAVTNSVRLYTNLFFADYSQNLMGISWVEKSGHGDLFDTVQQDLITYSKPHDTIFESKNKKIVVGGASFVIPPNAGLGQTYRMRIGRPSGTDGNGDDVTLDTPDGSDPNTKLRAVEDITVGQRRYLVGDVAPFRWFNAGDFGDGTILNNDLVQLHSGILGENLPPPGSDFLDAMDSCCVTTNITGYNTNLVILTNVVFGTNVFVTNVVNLITNYDVVNVADLMTNTVITTNLVFSTNYFTTNLLDVVTNYVVVTNYLDATNFELITNILSTVTNVFDTTNVVEVLTNELYQFDDVISTNFTTTTNIIGFATNFFAFTNVVVVSNYVTSTNFLPIPLYQDAASFFAHEDGNDLLINQIGFGDGTLDVADMYVSFRRSLDPGLANFVRYWSNGLRQASLSSNLFRGEARSTKSSLHAKSAPLIDPANPPSVTFSADGLETRPGELVSVPIRAKVRGGLAAKALLLRLSVKTIDGPVSVDQPVSFVPSASLGAPTLTGSKSPQTYAASWLGLDHAGLADDAVVGTLQVRIPTNATPNTALLVHFEHASASPNGLLVMASTNVDGVLTMNNRTAAAWNDGIPDSWRIQYFGSLLNVLSAPDADADGDGMSNLAEFKAGTNPTDFNSRLHLQSGSPLGVFTLRWPGGTNAVYVLQASPSLENGSWVTLESNLTGTGAMMEYRPQIENAHCQFYRLRLAE